MVSALLATVLLSVEPVCAGPYELGPNDFLVSGDFLLGTTFDSLFPAIAYNPDNDNYLVVWEERYRHLGCDEGVVTPEIHMRLVDGPTGTPVGGRETAISSMGSLCDGYGAREPAVAYNSTDNEYLVVWSGSDDADGGLVDEYEIFARRVNAETGFTTGLPQRRITAVGGIGPSSLDAGRPDVAYNASNNEYLVVYSLGFRVEALVLDASATTLHGPVILDPPSTFGNDPAVAWSSAHNEFLVTWWSLMTGKPGSEILAVYLDQDAAPVSITYPVTDPGEIAEWDLVNALPDLAYDPTNDQFLVVWEGEAEGARISSLVSERILAQRFGGDSTSVGALGTNRTVGPASGVGGAPAVSHSASDDEFFVVWSASRAPDGYESWARRVDATGQQLGEEDIRLSDLGGTDNDDWNGGFPAIAWNSQSNEYLVVWWGDDDIAAGPGGGGSDNDAEIYGQRVSLRVLFADGFESGNTSAW